MKRLHLFKNHPHTRMHERAHEPEAPEESQNEEPELTPHRSETDTSFEYSVSLDDEPKWSIRINKESGKVHMYMVERSIDFESIGELYDHCPELAVYYDGNVWASFRAMLSDDGHDLPPDPRNAESPTPVNEQEHEKHDEKCGQDCIEYRFTIGPNSFQFRINPETNMCSLQTDYPERTFHLDDIFDKVPEISMILRGTLLVGLKRRLSGDGIQMPDTPEYEVGYPIRNKDKD